MARRSIYAQIDEVRELLERREREADRARGPAESLAQEHVLRIECVLATLEWVRDHQDEIRSIAIARKKRTAAEQS